MCCVLQNDGRASVKSSGVKLLLRDQGCVKISPASWVRGPTD